MCRVSKHDGAVCSLKPIHERLECGAERVPGIDRSIEASFAKLDGLFASPRERDVFAALAD